MKNRRRNFEQTPFINIDRVAKQWEEIFSLPNCPTWVHQIVPIHADPAPGVLPSEVLLVVWARNKADMQPIYLSPFCAAVIFEMCRVGPSVHMNSNHKKPVPQRYAKMAFPGARGNFMNIRRILFGAKAYEATKHLWRVHDYSPENTSVEADGHSITNAREVAMEHVQRLLSERQEAGTLSPGFDSEAYLANIDDLFRQIDGQTATHSGDYLLPDGTYDFAKIERELIASLERGVVDISPAARAAMSGSSDGVVDDYLLDVLGRWAATIEGRKAEARQLLGLHARWKS